MNCRLRCMNCLSWSRINFYNRCYMSCYFFAILIFKYNIKLILNKSCFYILFFKKKFTYISRVTIFISNRIVRNLIPICNIFNICRSRTDVSICSCIRCYSMRYLIFYWFNLNSGILWNLYVTCPVNFSVFILSFFSNTGRSIWINNRTWFWRNLSTMICYTMYYSLVSTTSIWIIILIWAI